MNNLAPFAAALAVTCEGGARAPAFALADGAIGAGDLFMTVKVDDKGEPQSTSVYTTPRQRVSRASAIGLINTKYRRAMCTGTTRTSEFPLTARFE